MEKKDYYVGVDIGTNSVGFAATDIDYVPLRCNSKTLLGVRLFDEALPAVETRTFRSSRRRNMRKHERSKCLEGLFASEIAAVDMGFFQRLSDSKYYKEDKKVNKQYLETNEEHLMQKYAFFGDKHYTDVDFNKEYPTIYHLRQKLIYTDEKLDIRLLYLAIHHIIKNRGHFLFDNLEEDVQIPTFADVFGALKYYLCEEMELDINGDMAEIEAVLRNDTISRVEKGKQLCSVCGVKKTSKNPAEKQVATILELICGLSKSLSDLFCDEQYKDAELKNVSLMDDMDVKMPQLEAILDENVELIEKAKDVYDWSVLANVLKDKKYISDAKVEIYETHKSDLALLKSCIKKFLTLDEKRAILNEPKLTKIGKKDDESKEEADDGKKKENKKASYVAYRNRHCSQEDMCKFLEGFFKKKTPDADLEKLMAKLQARTFLPKQVSKDNGAIPYQVPLTELKAILNKAKRHYPFLLSVDASGISVSDKIIAIMKFRVPYSVGPLNKHSDKAWIVRKEEGKIYPWNFEQMVDTEASAEAFITNLTNKCTYIPTEDVIPKNSLLYASFMVLNQLNKVKINDEAIDVALKQDIYHDLFETHYKVTGKTLKDYLVGRNRMSKNDTISGIDKDFTVSLKAYNDLKNIILQYNNEAMVEDIIRNITLFGDDKKILKKRLVGRFGNVLSEKDMEYVLNKKYKDWSQLSKMFLMDIHNVDKNTGEVRNIITMLWETNENLMELLSSKYTFTESLEAYNKKWNTEVQTVREMVNDMYVSPSVKRPILQAIEIINEIQKLEKHAPKKIFIEMARAEDKDKKRTVTRKEQLLKIYKSGNIDETLMAVLNAKNDDELRRDRLYLYFTQLGKCIYSGEKIDIEDLYNENIYDVDHIYPQSKIKDDSLNNRVLVKKNLNAGKTDVYPISSDIRTAEQGFWATLKAKELISLEKYNRLIRSTELTDDELNIFAERQLVETRQATKALAAVLKQLYDEEQTEIVYVKGNMVSDFRNGNNVKNNNEIIKENVLLKSRDINDYHHAKDAYLNIVVGNVYNVKFTHNKINFIKGLKDNGKNSISLNRMFDFDIEGAWKRGNDGTMATVRETMAKNNIMYTCYPHTECGEFFERTIKPKGSGQAPIKAKDKKLSNIEKYGGYNSIKAAYYILVEHTDSKKKSVQRTIEPVYIYLRHIYEKSPEGQKEYCKTVLNLENPVILIKEIKIGTLFCMDGFKMHLTGRTGTYIVFKCAEQLIVGQKWETYTKKLSKVKAKIVEKRKTKEEVTLTRFDEISKEENLAFYDILTDKLKNTKYSTVFALQGNYLVDGRELFVAASINDQVEFLLEVINMMHCNRVIADFTLIGKKGTGAIKISKDIESISKKHKQFSIINQSITGMFEQEVDLLGADFTPHKRRG